MSAGRPWPPHKIREACEAEAVLPLETVGEMRGKGKTATYAWAKHDDFPLRVDKRGRPWTVPSADVLRYFFGEVGPEGDPRM